jgi:hypothetical protein
LRFGPRPRRGAVADLDRGPSLAERLREVRAARGLTDAPIQEVVDRDVSWDDADPDAEGVEMDCCTRDRQ